MAMVQRRGTSPGRDLLSTPGSATSHGPGLRNAIPPLRTCEARARLGLTFSKCLEFSHKKLTVKNGIRKHEKLIPIFRGKGLTSISSLHRLPNSGIFISLKITFSKGTCKRPHWPSCEEDAFVLCRKSPLARITTDFRQALGRRNATGKPHLIKGLDIPTHRDPWPGRVCDSTGNSS